ncbi:MAG: DUF5060 domain-containing protein [Verrucomicrobia bacterium]|nr:DUF5060 domain-containing protein [Verrucomicrobiota bacterium]
MLAVDADAALQLRASTNTVGAFAKVDFTIAGLTKYADPFDPEIVDLGVEFVAPGGRQIVVPAFFAQEYERRRPGEDGAPRDWIYPLRAGEWKASFAPSLVGKYTAAAVLKDGVGELRSAPVTFDCVPSNAKGFIRIARKDPRFLEFDNGEPFFAIGQNLAFIGEQQYVTVAKAEEIFAELAENGANYLRVWTCAEDWALAIEARKSAWGRSWSGRGRIVTDPDDPTRKCLFMTSSNATQEVNPSHPVALRPSTRYVVTGKVRTETNVALRLELQGASSPPLKSAAALAWTGFRHEFATGAHDWRLGAMRFRLEGQGAAWLSDLSLKEIDSATAGSTANLAVAGGNLPPSSSRGAEPRAASSLKTQSGGLVARRDGQVARATPELLWEADVNRPMRGFYNPLDCFLLDELVSAAERHGIYLQLCMLTRDLYMNALTNAASTSYERAVTDAKKFFRYAIARWGYSTSIAAWEYWNEMNPGLPTDRFYAELGEFFEKNDPYHHLRTTSTWGPSAKDCLHPKLDLADVHFYFRPIDKARLANEVEAVLERTRWLREQSPSKPAHLGEFGLADDKWRITENMRRSSDLSDMHNGLWASALSGASGTALFWWWERIDQRNGYPIYRPLSRFIADVPWNSGEVHQLEANCSDETMRVVGLRAGTLAWFWLFDPAAAWEKLAFAKQDPPERREIIVELSGWPGKAPRLEWWGTRDGRVTESGTPAPSNGTLRLKVPPFRRDIAWRLVGD